MACRISGGCAGSSGGRGANDARAWVLCAARCLPLDAVTFLETNGRRPGLDSQRRAAGRTAAPEISRRRMFLLRGRGVFILSGLSATLGLALLVIRQQATTVWPVAIWLAVLTAALAARPRWVFLWFDPEGFAAEVEASLRMLLIPFV